MLLDYVNIKCVGFEIFQETYFLNSKIHNLVQVDLIYHIIRQLID